MSSNGPLISQAELDKLLQILALQHTLGQIAAHFSHEFSADRKFYAGTCIASLLHDQLLALPQARELQAVGELGSPPPAARACV